MGINLRALSDEVTALATAGKPIARDFDAALKAEQHAFGLVDDFVPWRNDVAPKLPAEIRAQAIASLESAEATYRQVATGLDDAFESGSWMSATATAAGDYVHEARRILAEVDGPNTVVRARALLQNNFFPQREAIRFLRDADAPQLADPVWFEDVRPFSADRVARALQGADEYTAALVRG